MHLARVRVGVRARVRVRVRVRVKGLVLGPMGPGASAPLGGAQDPNVRNMRFRSQGM